MFHVRTSLTKQNIFSTSSDVASFQLEDKIIEQYTAKFEQGSIEYTVRILRSESKRRTDRKSQSSTANDDDRPGTDDEEKGGKSVHAVRCYVRIQNPS